MKSKKAQLELTFNWIYILIAGAIILLFFIGIAFKGKAVAEERLEEEVVRVMESIFIGAGVSEKTKNLVETSGLADYTLEFKCENDYAGFGIKGGAFRELKTEPIFAPAEIRATKLVLWSLPYNFPYKTMDLLFITSSNTKYFFLGDGQGLREELEKAKENLNFDFGFMAEEELGGAEAGNNFQVRMIYLDGGLQEGSPVPVNFQNLDSSRLTALNFRGENLVEYFRKNEQNKWERLSPPVNIISLGGEKDAAKYAALFAADGESYRCNMLKVFRRLLYVTEVYERKLNLIAQYYRENAFAPAREECQSILEEQTGNLVETLTRFKTRISSCRLGGYSRCQDLPTEAQELKTLNEALGREPCLKLY